MNAEYAMAEERSYKAKSDQRKMKPVKRPGFLANWFFKKVVEGAEYEKRNTKGPDMLIGASTLNQSIVGREGPSIDQPERAIQFTIYTANGGRVVETRRYDRTKDRHFNGLYVITSDQDFGKEIDKIITMESLK